jgi:hypothetical protein
MQTLEDGISYVRINQIVILLSVRRSEFHLCKRTKVRFFISLEEDGLACQKEMTGVSVSGRRDIVIGSASIDICEPLILTLVYQHPLPACNGIYNMYWD